MGFQPIGVRFKSHTALIKGILLAVSQNEAPFRLLASAIGLQAVMDARLRKAHQEEKRKGKQFSKLHLDLLAWETYLTNLPRAEADARKVAAIHRLRWRIEIVFKALKGYTPGPELAKHHTNPHHVQVLAIAWLCLVVLAVRTGGFALATAAGLGGTLVPKCLSLLKVIPKVFQFLGLVLFVVCAPDLHTLVERWHRQTAYHDRCERRKNARTSPIFWIAHCW